MISDLRRGDRPRQRDADAEPHRIAGRQHHHRPAAPARGSPRRSATAASAQLRRSAWTVAAAWPDGARRRRSAPRPRSAMRRGRRQARSSPSSPTPMMVSQGSWSASHRRPAPISSALTAAAASALPPRRPRRVTIGDAEPGAISASLDSAAPTKPTGKPRIAAGRGRAVGRAARADGTAPSARCRSPPPRRRGARARARPRRPNAWCRCAVPLRQRGTLGPSVQITSFGAGSWRA